MAARPAAKAGARDFFENRKDEVSLNNTANGAHAPVSKDRSRPVLWDRVV